MSQLLKYQSTCNKKVSQKTKNLQMKNQRFQSGRLSVNYNWSMDALNIKIKDFNQGGWPQIMPSSAKPGQAQPEALRFSQLKKKNFWGFSPLVLTIERPLQIYQEAQYSPKGGFKNLEFNFFAYLFLLSHRFCQGRSILRKKTSRFSKGKE